MAEQKNLVIVSGVVIKPPIENVKFDGYWCNILTGNKTSVLPVFIPRNLFKPAQEQNRFTVGSHIEVPCIVKPSPSGKPLIYAISAIHKCSEREKKFNHVTLQGYVMGQTRYDVQKVFKHDRVVFAQDIATREMQHINKNKESTFIDIRSNNLKQISEIYTGEEIMVDGEIRFNKHSSNGMFIWPNKIKR